MKFFAPCIISLALFFFLGSPAFAQTTKTPTGNQTSNVIDVTTFGAVGDGVTDCYDALQQIATQISGTSNVTVYFPPGVYRIDRYRITGGPNANGVKNIFFLNCSNLTISGAGAKIDVKGDFNQSADYQSGGYWYSYSDEVIPFGFKNCTNFIVDGLEVDGNVDQMTRDSSVVEGYAHGIVTGGCSDYAIQNVHVHHFETDGLYLGDSLTVADRDMTLDNVTSEHCSRQGLTIAQVRDATISNCTFEHAGLTDGSYGGHAPMAGIDVEPTLLTGVDVNTGNLLFTGCTLRNNQGPQFQCGGANRDHLTLQGCHIYQDTSTTANTVLLVVPQGVIDGCDMDVQQINVSEDNYPTTSTTVRNCRITSDYRGIVDWVDTPSTTVLITGNTLTGTQTAPLTTQMPLLHNPNTTFTGNTVLIPAAAKTTQAATSACLLDGIQESSGNTFQTDYQPVNGSHFYTDYGTTETVINDTYASGSAFRPGPNSTWDTSVPYSYDGLNPTVSFTAPADGSTVSGTVLLQAGASDNVGVSSVNFTLDGKALGAGTLVNGIYQYSWDSTTAANGTHTLATKATDAAGNSSSSQVSVTVKNQDTTPPTITITAPASGAKVSGSVNVTVSTSDNIAVVKVELYVDSKLAATSTKSPFTTRWSTTSASKGKHNLQCKAYDAANNVGLSPIVTVTK